MNKNYLTIIKAGYHFAEVEEYPDFTEDYHQSDEESEDMVVDWRLSVGIVKGIIKDGKYEDSSHVWLSCSEFNLSAGTHRPDELDRAFKHAPANSVLDRAMVSMIDSAEHFSANLAAAEAATIRQLFNAERTGIVCRL